MQSICNLFSLFILKYMWKIIIIYNNFYTNFKNALFMKKIINFDILLINKKKYIFIKYIIYIDIYLFLNTILY